MGAEIRTTVVLITGAASGIGRACAVELARVGKDLLLWDIDSQGLEVVKEEVLRVQPGAKVINHCVDVSQEESVNEAAQEAFRASIDVAGLVAAAGIARVDGLTIPAPNDHAMVMKVNYNGVVNTTTSVSDSIIRCRGSIVLIGSTEGMRGAAELHAYCASKHAVHAFGKCAAMELGPLGVRVNILAPGTIKTPTYNPEAMGEEAMALDVALRARTPLRRIGTAEEVATVARFLLSDDASYINGAEIVVDGGLTA